MSSQVEMLNEFGSTFSKGGFNASVFVSEQLNRQTVNMIQDLAHRCVKECATKYGFDAEEAIRFLNLTTIKLERKTETKGLKAKVAKVQAPKSAFPLPYNGEFNENCCFALRQNNGLYTQCTGVRKGENQFCKSCATTLQKTGAEVPEYGTIQQRQAVDIFEFVDPKGRKPIAYTKVMKKYKISEEQAIEEAGKFNIIINSQHFVASEEAVKRGRPAAQKEPKIKGTKGRPKKSKKVLQIEGEEEDLFASLVAQANEESEEEEVVVAPKKKGGKSDEEKEAERLAKLEEKEAKRVAAEKAKAEKEAKLAAEKAEKEAKKKAEEEARAAKKKAEEEEKAAKKAAFEAAKKAKEATKKAPAKKAVVEEDDEPDVVKKIEFEGKKYLKSKKTGIIYDYTEYTKNGEQVVIGKWNETSNKIDFAKADEEEEEEEYDN
jgi:chemotaxis protein histidine kinase CheA